MGTDHFATNYLCDHHRHSDDRAFSTFEQIQKLGHEGSANVRVPQITPGKTPGKERNSRLDADERTSMTDLIPIHFYDDVIKVQFDEAPVREKAPHCPNGFIWDEQTYRITAALAEWTDFSRKGKMAKNMRPAHAEAASIRGSLNVGRYYFRVQVESGRIFDIYYDRAMKSVDDRKGQWFIYRELEQSNGTTTAKQ